MDRPSVESSLRLERCLSTMGVPHSRTVRLMSRANVVLYGDCLMRAFCHGPHQQVQRDSNAAIWPASDRPVVPRSKWPEGALSSIWSNERRDGAYSGD